MTTVQCELICLNFRSKKFEACYAGIRLYCFYHKNFLSFMYFNEYFGSDFMKYKPKIIKFIPKFDQLCSALWLIKRVIKSLFGTISVLEVRILPSVIKMTTTTQVVSRSTVNKIPPMTAMNCDQIYTFYCNFFLRIMQLLWRS